MLKFEEAFCQSDKKTYSIDVITLMYKTQSSIYHEDFQGSLMCPECQIAHLSYNNAASPYFSTYPNARHTPDCSLAQDVMPPNQVKNLIADKCNHDLICRQLQSVFMRVLAPCYATHQPIKSTTPICSTSVSTSPDKPGLSFSKRLPQKRIDLAFTVDDFDSWKLFYGMVRITWEAAKKEGQFKLLLYSTSKHRLLCKLYITSTVYHHFAASVQCVQPNTLCAVAFLGVFEAKDIGKPYRSCNLIDSRYLRLSTEANTSPLT